MLSAAGSLQWLRETVGGTYDELLGGAAEWEPGVEGLLFAPYLAGERTPHADPGARGAFAGLGLRHDRGALARAVLEGVAFGAARRARPRRGARRAPARRAHLGRRRALAAVAGDRRLGARDAARGDRRRRGRRLRRGAARRRGRRRVGRRARGGGGVREGHAHDRAAARVDRALRRGPRALPRPVPGAAPAAGAAAPNVGLPCSGRDFVRRSPPSLRLLAAFCAILHGDGRHRHRTRAARRGAPRARSCAGWAPRARSAPRTWRCGCGVSLDTVRRDLQELADAGAAAPRPRRRAAAQPARARLVRRAPARRRRRQGRRRPGRGRASSGPARSSPSAAARRRSSSRAGCPTTSTRPSIATNPHIAVALADHPRLTVDVVGGRLHPPARTVVGPEAVDALRARAPRRLRAHAPARCTPASA